VNALYFFRIARNFHQIAELQRLRRTRLRDFSCVLDSNTGSVAKFGAVSQPFRRTVFDFLSQLLRLACAGRSLCTAATPATKLSWPELCGTEAIVERDELDGGGCHANHSLVPGSAVGGRSLVDAHPRNLETRFKIKNQRVT
jgi:hypothetical protein